MMNIIEKVTGFVTRDTADGLELLLFKHPFAGIQIPAGTVEKNEPPEEAVLREVREETGLTAVEIQTDLGTEIEMLPDGQQVIIPPAVVYSRPDRTSFDWIRIKSAVQVRVGRQESGFTQFTYFEYDQVPDTNYISMQITGWVPDEFLAAARHRHFYHLAFTGHTPDTRQAPKSWEIFTDNHTFKPFWAPLSDLPDIIAPQDQWLKYLRKEFKIPSKGNRSNF